MLNQHRRLGGMRMVLLIIVVLYLIIPSIAIAADNEKEQERVKESGNVMKELLNSESGVPISVLNKAECVIVIPSLKKGGFIIAAEYGRGVMTCRGGENLNGPWSAPTMMQSTGGSIGFQAGGQSTDVVILVMNDKGARALMNGKAKLGADASVAAGPVGREAEAATNAAMSAQMLSYSRAQGIFAGVSLEGSSLGPDSGANEKLYGKKVTATEIISGGAGPAPASAQELLAVLTEKSPKNESEGKTAAAAPAPPSAPTSSAPETSAGAPASASPTTTPAAAPVPTTETPSRGVSLPLIIGLVVVLLLIVVWMVAKAARSKPRT
jgi:lipid-binding SYLF domain-containing protein